MRARAGAVSGVADGGQSRPRRFRGESGTAGVGRPHGNVAGLPPPGLAGSCRSGGRPCTGAGSPSARRCRKPSRSLAAAVRCTSRAVPLTTTRAASSTGRRDREGLGGARADQRLARGSWPALRWVAAADRRGRGSAHPDSRQGGSVADTLHRIGPHGARRLGQRTRLYEDYAQVVEVEGREVHVDRGMLAS